MSELTFELDADETSVLELKFGQYIKGDKGDTGPRGETGADGALKPQDVAYIDAATASAQASANAAAGSASAAANSASSAASSAAQAKSDGQAAVNAAQGYAQQAGISATAAQGSASQASASRDAAASSAAAAAASSTSAGAWEALAQDWAIKMNGLVSGTDYSSKYYAGQSSASATASAGSASQSAASAANADQSKQAAAGSAAAAAGSASAAAGSAQDAADSAASVNAANLVLVDGSHAMTAPLKTPGLALQGLGSRITGDFSNATQTNRVQFQSSVLNGNTTLSALPNGTATQTGLNLWSSVDPNNAVLAQLLNIGTEVRLTASANGTGAFAPLTFYTGGLERFRLAAAANRFQADFSNATQANRFLFQSTSNQQTNVGAIPGAAGSGAGFVGFGGLDPNNAPYASIIHDGFAGLIRSDKTGTANYSPLNFMTGGVVRYAIDATGAHTFSGPISTNSNLTLNGNSIELGPTAAGPAYIDFHSSGTGNDFDTRLISSGGSSGAGNGTLDIYAGSINFRSSQGVAPIFFNASGYAPHMRSNSSNSSFEWINGANSAANMTLSDAGYLTVRNGISWSQPSSGVGSLTMSNELVMANSNLIRFNATNGYTATIRADTSNMVGFINMAGNAWNTQLYDDGSFWIRNQWQWGDRSNTSGQYNGTGSTGGHTERNAIVQQSDNVNMYLSHTGGGGTLEWFGCAGNNVGAIGCNTTSTSYATTSDYRLKTDVEDLTGGLDRVMLMRPVTFTWIASGQPDRGFIAHELQPVEPSAVTGEKDEMMLDPMNPDAGEVPKYQAVDLSFCIPDMVAALQEMKQQLDVALARIATLEAAR